MGTGLLVRRNERDGSARVGCRSPDDRKREPLLLRSEDEEEAKSRYRSFRTRLPHTASRACWDGDGDGNDILVRLSRSRISNPNLVPTRGLSEGRSRIGITLLLRTRYRSSTIHQGSNRTRSRNYTLFWQISSTRETPPASGTLQSPTKPWSFHCSKIS